MGDDEDYLSDKFLVETAAPTRPQTYAEKRKEARRQSQVKNEQNRLKSRRQIELESREEGLSKSLFERAKEDEASGVTTGNKALSMMMKMGFKPGQALGKLEDEPTPASSEGETSNARESTALPEAGGSHKVLQHKTEPVPINEWMGKKGIGLGKRPRPPSPTSAERVAKMAKMAEAAGHENYRDRARQEYEERRDDGRLFPAQRTCVTLDEKAGKSFNILWLNPKNPESFPEGLVEALNDSITDAGLDSRSVQSRLRSKMEADSLQPLKFGLDEDTTDERPSMKELFSPETIEEATQFLRLNARDRLQLVLTYLRDKYAYCFWCGTQYDGFDEMNEQCPGPDEDSHD